MAQEKGSPIDIHACSEEALRLSCEKGHKEIAQWLCKIIIENKKGV